MRLVTIVLFALVASASALTTDLNTITSLLVTDGHPTNGWVGLKSAGNIYGDESEDPDDLSVVCDETWVFPFLAPATWQEDQWRVRVGADGYNTGVPKEAWCDVYLGSVVVDGFAYEFVEEE